MQNQSKESNKSRTEKKRKKIWTNSDLQLKASDFKLDKKITSLIKFSPVWDSQTTANSK